MAGLGTALAVCSLLLGPAALAASGPADQRLTASHQARRLLDFGVQGAIIWNEPRAGSGRNGLGYAGQGFDSDRQEEHALYQCGNGQSTHTWFHGRNVTTGVVGWVPGCNLADPD